MIHFRGRFSAAGRSLNKHLSHRAGTIRCKHLPIETSLRGLCETFAPAIPRFSLERTFNNSARETFIPGNFKSEETEMGYVLFMLCLINFIITDVSATATVAKGYPSL